MSKKIIICFDGTKNDPSDASQDIYEDGGVKDDGISNILKLYFLLGGRIENINQSQDEEGDLLKKSHFQGQHCFYFQGVGSYGGSFRKLVNSAISPHFLDVRHIIVKGMEALIAAKYQPGDEIYLFGFSRGAAIARRFAKVIQDHERVKGLNLKEDAVRFLGVFDTVSSFGLPNLVPNTEAKSNVLFEDKNRITSNIQEALHLLSLDERRLAFRPTLMAMEDRVTEVWFPGVHSDIGGGYFYDGLSDITLDFLLKEFERRNLNLQIRLENEIVEKEFFNEQYGLDIKDIEIKPNHLSKLHWHERFLDLLLDDRDLRVCKSENNDVVNQKPLIHQAAIDLIGDSHAYEPASLIEGLPHQVIDTDGSIDAEMIMDIKTYRQNSSQPIKSLGIGANITRQIHATQLYCPTFIKVKQGEKYSFEFEKSKQWVDKTIACDATGWTAEDKLSFLKGLLVRATEPLRRHSEANWFELLGSVGRQDKNAFRAIKHDETNPYVIEETGELFMFPNDLVRTYGNNRGYIEVTIKRHE